MPTTCAFCSEAFASRNKLFKHLRECAPAIASGIRSKLRQGEPRKVAVFFGYDPLLGDADAPLDVHGALCSALRRVSASDPGAASPFSVGRATRDARRELRCLNQAFLLSQSELFSRLQFHLRLDFLFLRSLRGFGANGTRILLLLLLSFCSSLLAFRHQLLCHSHGRVPHE